MALVDVDSWQTEFDSCSRLNSTLLSQLKQRDGKIYASPDYNRLTLSMQVGLKQLDRELQQLKFKLNEASRTQSIAFEECERRQQQLDALQSQYDQLKNKYSNTNDRTALFETSANRPSTGASGGVDTGEDSDAAPIIDVQRLKEVQHNMIEEQNRGLETLSQTISRQRALATQFGQEVADQNDILDNLANTIERVESGVNAETRNISLVNRRDSTWGYWIVIIVLFIAIVIVALL